VTKANRFGPSQPHRAERLHQKEAQQAKQGTQHQRLAATDQARLAQQAGFARTGRQKGKGLDIGDSSHAPIPLPEEDTANEDAWSSQRLEQAQRTLGFASAQFEEITQADEVDVGESVTGSSFLPTEAGLAQLDELSRRPAPEPIPIDEVTADLERLFAIKIDTEVPLGHRLLAAGLVAAGESRSVDAENGKLDERKLAAGVQKVAEKSNQAVGEAQRNIKGIDRELNVQRTFVHRR
jgi:hypothetical protein